jgi:hypothetical protein
VKNVKTCGQFLEPLYYDTHQQWTHRVLQRLRDNLLHLKPEKCTFNVDSIDYLGMIIKPGSIAMDPAKLKGTSKWKTPMKVKEVQSFLRFTNFYQQFIANYSTIA